MTLDDNAVLSLLRARWLEVLDELERSNRTAWLALFDARIARVEAGCAVLDFSDRDKFAGAHTFDVNARPDYLVALSTAVSTALGLHLTFTIQSITRE
ncbi:MAG: hypothetical protein EBU85_05280 [Actinobacteria bacterium]|nr:hypothetical protein [Actinomycetota bacterium]